MGTQLQGRVGDPQETKGNGCGYLLTASEVINRYVQSGADHLNTSQSYELAVEICKTRGDGLEGSSGPFNL